MPVHNPHEAGRVAPRGAVETFLPCRCHHHERRGIDEHAVVIGDVTYLLDGRDRRISGSVTVAPGRATMRKMLSEPLAGELQTFAFTVDRLVLITPRAHPFGKKRRLSFNDTLD